MKNVKIAGAVVTGLSMIAGTGSYIEQLNDVEIEGMSVVFDSQEEYQAKKTELKDKYLNKEIKRLDDAKDLAAMIRYEKGDTFQELKEYIKNKETRNLFDRQILIAVIQGQQEIRREEMLLFDKSETPVKDEINKYLEL